jgi:hypothetical protein
MKRIVSALFLGVLVIGACSKSNNCVAVYKEGCIVPEILAPVCGCDGVTYDNSWAAECAGITDFVQGRCED